VTTAVVILRSGATKDLAREQILRFAQDDTALTRVIIASR